MDEYFNQVNETRKKIETYNKCLINYSEEIKHLKINQCVSLKKLYTTEKELNKYICLLQDLLIYISIIKDCYNIENEILKNLKIGENDGKNNT